MSRTAVAKEKLLNAALGVIREKGYAATTVDDLCARAGVTKGAFFHHFKSKDALGVAAAQHWSTVTGALFERAPYHDHPDPLDRVLAYIDFRRALLDGAIPEVTCVVGTMVQETYGQHPEIRDACAMSIFGHADTLVDDIHAAMRDRGVTGNWSAESCCTYAGGAPGRLHLGQGEGDVDVAVEREHLRRYVELLFSQPVTAPRRQ
ncbi:MAG: TetR/AcrR family transcriptional regulator [Polyangiales bacterium]